jgi:hypothetical protein
VLHASFKTKLAFDRCASRRDWGPKQSVETLLNRLQLQGVVDKSAVIERTFAAVQRQGGPLYRKRTPLSKILRKNSAISANMPISSSEFAELAGRSPRAQCPCN